MRRLSKYVIALCAVVGLLSVRVSSAEASDAPKAVLSVKVSPEADFSSEVEFKNYGALERAINKGKHLRTEEAPVSDVYVVIEKDGKRFTYVVDSSGNLYDDRWQEKIEIERKMKTVLLSYAERVRPLHYGKLVRWDEVIRIIPKKSILKVTDVETGLSFNVQRRAGKHHADVQPVTKKDTAIMKKIYGGKWSWRRKAILVDTGGHRFAASMNGMPHGGDGIPGNNFSGHFCIHFWGSSTHGSGNIDPMHQLMVYKAAGKLEPYFATASPYKIIEAFFNALNMGEQQVLRTMFTHANNESLLSFLEELHELQSITGELAGEETDSSGLLSLDLSYEVRIVREHGRKERPTYLFHLKRITFTEAWKIDRVEVNWT